MALAQDVVKFLAMMALVVVVACVSGVNGQTQSYQMNPTTATATPQHPFCTAPPVAQSPKIPIFELDVKTGFFNGYRSNQSVIVEVKAKYTDIWRIQQVFFTVPEHNPYLVRKLAAGAPRTVGHWSWKMAPGHAFNNDAGSSKPVDCGGTSTYGPLGMMGLGAHAAMEVNEWPYVTDKGYNSVKALWVPPNDFENILLRKSITIMAYVTFDKQKPTMSHGAHVQHTHSVPHTHHVVRRAPMDWNTYAWGHSFQSGQYGMQQQPQQQQQQQHQSVPTAPAQSRWVALSATILSLDYIDMHNYLIMNYGPWYRYIISSYTSRYLPPSKPAAGQAGVTPEP